VADLKRLENIKLPGYNDDGGYGDAAAESGTGNTQTFWKQVGL
jgi:hypothetical protein